MGGVTWLWLEDHRGNPVLVNASNICLIKRHLGTDDRWESIILFHGGEQLWSDLTPKEIGAIIGVPDMTKRREAKIDG